MNWDAIGAIAELLGAIGVIASLVYLATQIRESREQMRENTRVTRASGYQSYFQNLDAVATRSTTSPEMARAARLGLEGMNRLDEDQGFYFNSWITGLLLALDNGHYQFRTGILERDRWQILRGSLAGLMSNPGAREWWSQVPIRTSLSPEFVALVEEILGEEPGRED
jgi:hypothetical protein